LLSTAQLVPLRHGVHCLVVAVLAFPSAGDEEENTTESAEESGSGNNSSSASVEVSAAHVGAMQALSYVAKGKPNRKFVLVTPDGTCGAVVETRRTSFVYRTPPPPSSPTSSTMSAASASTFGASSHTAASSGLHQILDLSTCAAGAAAEHADAPVLGARLVASTDSGGGGGSGGEARLVLLLAGAVVTQGIRDVLHG
jgi:hypothetical protein